MSLCWKTTIYDAIGLLNGSLMKVFGHSCKLITEIDNEAFALMSYPRSWAEAGCRSRPAGERWSASRWPGGPGCFGSSCNTLVSERSVKKVAMQQFAADLRIFLRMEKIRREE